MRFWAWFSTSFTPWYVNVEVLFFGCQLNTFWNVTFGWSFHTRLNSNPWSQADPFGLQPPVIAPGRIHSNTRTPKARKKRYKISGQFMITSRSIRTAATYDRPGPDPFEYSDAQGRTSLKYLGLPLCQYVHHKLTLKWTIWPLIGFLLCSLCIANLTLNSISIREKLPLRKKQESMRHFLLRMV